LVGSSSEVETRHFDFPYLEGIRSRETMAELSELDRILNLPDLALEQLWNLMDDEKDQTLKFLIGVIIFTNS